MKQSNHAQATPKKTNIVLRVLAFLLGTALILGAVALVAFREELNLDALRRWLHYRSIETSQTGQAEPFTHGGGEELDIVCLEKGYLFSSTAGAHYYSFSGKEIASQVAHTEKPVLAACGGYGAVYNAGGDSVYLFGRTQDPFVYSPDGGILSARPNSAGWLAVTALQSHYRGAVTVLDQDHNPVVSLNYSSAFVTDAILSPDGKTVVVVTISQVDGSFRSTLHLHRVDKEEPFATVVLEGFTVLDMDFDDSGIWLLGPSSLITLSPRGEDRRDFPFDPSTLKGYTLDGDGFAVLMLGKYRAGAASDLLTVDHDAQLIARQQLNAQVLSLCARGRYLALLSGHRLDIYTEDLTDYASLSDSQGARHVALSADASALLANSQEAWLFIPS